VPGDDGGLVELWGKGSQGTQTEYSLEGQRERVRAQVEKRLRGVPIVAVCSRQRCRDSTVRYRKDVRLKTKLRSSDLGGPFLEGEAHRSFRKRTIKRESRMSEA